MTKIDALCRFLLPCISPTTTNSTTSTTKTSPPTKKRLSTSLRDDLPQQSQEEEEDCDSDSPTTTQASVNNYNPHSIIRPRSSKSMVIGTLFGHRHGYHSFFCIQHDRLSTKPFLFLQLSIPTHLLVKEMKCGLVRIALESHRGRNTVAGSCPLSSVRQWSMCVNGRKVGFAARRRVNDKDRLILKIMQSISVGAGVIPSCEGGEGVLVYMRANYERLIGGYDSESFHLISPDGCPGQEFSVFLLRTG